jgi:hypothetical protein
VIELKRRRFDEAETLLRRALLADPKNQPALAALAWLYRGQDARRARGFALPRKQLPPRIGSRATPDRAPSGRDGVALAASRRLEARRRLRLVFTNRHERRASRSLREIKPIVHAPRERGRGSQREGDPESPEPDPPARTSWTRLFPTAAQRRSGPCEWQFRIRSGGDCARIGEGDLLRMRGAGAPRARWEPGPGPRAERRLG